MSPDFGFDSILKLAKLAFCLLFLVWVFLDASKKRNAEEHLSQREKPTVTRISASLNIIICLSYTAFCVYEFWRCGISNIDAILSATTWCFSCILAIHSAIKTPRKRHLVLTLWWGFSSLFNLFFAIVYLGQHFKLLVTTDLVPQSNVIDFVSLPLSLVLFFNDLCSTTAKESSDATEPLLEKQSRNDQLYGKVRFSSAGIWKKLTFGWLNPLFRIGYCKKLEVEDIPPIPRSDSAHEAALLLEESLRKQKGHLAKAILHAEWKPLVINGVFAGVNTMASCMGPILIRSFVNLLTKDENQTWVYGVTLALIFFASKTVESLCQRQWYFGSHRIGIRVRAALMALVYKKSLSIKHGGIINGKIINLLNVDAERIGEFCWYFHGFWLLPVQITFSLVLLYENLGVGPACAALFTAAFALVCNTPLANVQERLHRKIMESKDSRVKETSETIKNMRILKLYSWETEFLERLLQLRETEKVWLRRYLYTCSTVAFLFWASPTLVSLVTFGVSMVFRTPLTSGNVLSALAIFRILQEPIYNLPELISSTAQTKVSIDRVQNFILEQNEKKQIECYGYTTAGVAIEFEAGEFSWHSGVTKRPTIKLSEKLKIKRGSKIAICGSIGSGKTSLLFSIIGELHLVSGLSIRTSGSKSFVPQSSWIQTGTVRDNMLFGKEMDQTFYGQVIKACALNHDIEMWNAGDLYVVGERGFNLSGGQKQRIQMARALYHNSDIYLFDDPFSAVDANTGAHMFKTCLLQLLHEKTVVYVTHQLEFLAASDFILVMKDGRINELGTYQDLIVKQNGELLHLVEAHNKSLDQVNPRKFISSTKGKHQVEQIDENEVKLVDLCNSPLNQNEKTESGRVKWQVYAKFITAAYKGSLVPIVLLCQILFQILQMASNYWIAWGSEEESVTKMHLLIVFALLSCGSSLFILVRAFVLSTVAMETAQCLFLRMIKTIFQAPLSFFDSTPSSRILKRFSTDQSVVDTDIAYRLAGLAFAVIQLLSIVVLMSQITWHFLFLFLVVFAISIWYQSYYISTARELARMVPVQQAPVIHHFSESVSGATVIRTFNQKDRFWEKNLELIDNYSRVAFHNCGTMEWLCVRINVLFNIAFFLLLTVLVCFPRSAIDRTLAGLAATYGLNLNVLQAWIIWNLCNVENKMISVERILQFSCIPSEAPLILLNSRPEPEWPQDGRIEFRNLHIQFSPSLPRVLKGITCTFPGKKRIAVIGRTGSGKSTLIQALFRAVEPSEGYILIDGLDISKIGLHDLRSRLSIIPQDPILFQGTLRTNLDPLQEHSDPELWEVLRKCHLAENIKQNGDERLLDSPVAEDGENWSLGQRQLVCLARVLLQRRRILVMDEATASVDTATDNLIQMTLREETSECTVITIAHRIHTVIDNDLVMVLADGKVIEFDPPSSLLRDSNSAFSGLVELLRRSAAGGI